MAGRPLVILGAGSFAVETMEAAELSGRTVLGFLVSDKQFRSADQHEGKPIFVPDDLPWSPSEVSCIAGIVSTKRRGFIQAMLARDFEFAAVVHPTAIVSPRATIEAGALVGAGAIVSAHTRVGPHVILNRGANIAHDVTLGAYATVGPGAVVAGAVSIGASAWVGVGAVIRNQLAIGEGAVVGAGAVVVKPVAPHTMVAGSPASLMREGVDGL